MRSKIASAAIAATCLCSPALAQMMMPAQMAVGQQRFAHQPPPAAFQACVGRPVGSTVTLTPPGRAPIAATCVTGPTGVLFARPERPPFAGGVGQPSFGAPRPGTTMQFAPGQASPGQQPGY
jgi:hypothetical protein